MFFLLNERFIVTSQGDNCRNKGNNADTHNNNKAHIIPAAKKATKHQQYQKNKLCIFCLITDKTFQDKQ